MNIHTGLRFQRGRGFGSMFSGLLRGLKPLAQMGLSAGKRFFSSDLAKNIGSTALQMGTDALTNLAVDALEGKNIKESAQEQLDKAKSKIAQSLKGGGCKRKSKANHKHNKKNKPTIKQLQYNLLNE